MRFFKIIAGILSAKHERAVERAKAEIIADDRRESAIIKRRQQYNGPDIFGGEEEEEKKKKKIMLSHRSHSKKALEELLPKKSESLKKTIRQMPFDHRWWSARSAVTDRSADVVLV